VQGWAPPGLLDSYQSERHPVGRTALRVSGTLIRLATRKSWLARTARDIIAAAALRTGPIAGRAAGTVSGIGIGYPRPRGAHPLTGTRMPDLPLSPGADRTAARLFQLLDRTRFVLLAPAGTNVGGWQQRVDVATAADAPPTTILIRPDGYVAWATDQTGPAHLDATLPGALAHWCGPALIPAGSNDRSIPSRSDNPHPGLS
jgi:hypothetical protein